jgi:hypothetical protein
MNFLEASFDLCSFGWKVFPCKPGGKTPLVLAWQKVATDDEEVIADWARRFPNANVGIACGVKSNLAVVDLDAHHGAMEAVKQLQRSGYRFPSTLMVRTPSGGWHAYYTYVDGVKNSQSVLGKGIDIRGEGGFVVAPPSVKWDSGKGWTFASRPLGGNLPRLPKWMVDKLKPRVETPFYHEVYESGDIDGLLNFLQQIPEGQRNRALFWAACRAGKASACGEISQLEARAQLIQVGLSVGLEKHKVPATVDSGLRTGARS